METDWKLFGDRSRFAFEYRFRDDPDQGCAATPLESASWGEFRFWVRGKNLCQYHHGNRFHQETTWYLSPMFEWLLANWDPLFHEERFPLPCGKPNARLGYLDSLRRYLGDVDPAVESKAEAWYDWWQRHALRSCSQGGLFPDLFLRRLVDFAEITWGNFPLEGVGTDFYFTVPQGTALLPVEEVAEPLLEGVRDAVQTLHMRMVPNDEGNALAARIGEIVRERLDAWLSWYSESILTWKTRFGGISRPATGTGFIRRLSPAVAMFGSLSPRIGDNDLEVLFQSFVEAHQDGTGDPDRLQSLIPSRPEWPQREPHDAGYDAALDLLDAPGMVNDRQSWVDVRGICERLGIKLGEIALSDSNIRGVAFAGASVTPTILINASHSNNEREEGKRFTIGHELCHILHDRFFGGEVSIASGPWAPASVEQRANAFSAMLLMPIDMVNDHIRSMAAAPETIDGINQLAKALRVSHRSLVWHLYNLNKLDDDQRSLLETTITDR